MAKPITFVDGQILTAANLNLITPDVPNTGDLVDTGWVDCEYTLFPDGSASWTPGTGGQLRVRRTGKQVTVSGGATGPIKHATYLQCAVLPLGFRPPRITRTAGAATSGRTVLWEFAAGGQVRIAWNHQGVGGAAPTWGQVECTYYTD